MKKHPHTNFDFDKQPFLVIWETTRACDLACVHCRLAADPNPAPGELSCEEAKKLITDVAKMETPIFVFSGGDPLKRNDLAELIKYAKSLNLRTGAIPAVTKALTKERLIELKDAGLDQLAFSLDAADPATHDSFRRVNGVFKRTLEVVKIANELGFSVQINSLINVHNQKNFDELIALIESLDIVFWEVFFLVPIGRGKKLTLMNAQKYDEAFLRIYDLSKRAPFIIKITEAPHYRQFYIRKEMERNGIDIEKAEQEPIELPKYLRKTSGPGGSIGRAPLGVNSGKGFVFVSNLGDVYPSGFLPIKVGNVKEESLGEIYRNSPLLKKLRDSSLLKGKCGKCPYKDVCGGSRARAHAISGDYLAEDPCCSYKPKS